MTTDTTKILVVGVTGNQGRAVTHHLLQTQSQFDVYGLTRDPTTIHARALRDLGVTTVAGNLDDPMSFESALEEVDAVFSMTHSAAGYEKEVTHGTTLADIAAGVGVGHFVFSSINGANRATDLDGFDAKRTIEQHLTTFDLPVTILRPTWFMFNLDRYRPDIRDGQLALPLEEDISLQMLDVDDYGAFVARVFSEPEHYIDQAIEIAGDEHTLESMVSVLSDVVGKTIEPIHVPIEEVRSDELTAMYQWFNLEEHAIDIAALETAHDIRFTTLETYLRRRGWDNP
jgi:uncharacterized protein YbjT (DUF2867 family)